MALAQEDIIVRYISEGYEKIIREIFEADKSVDKLQKTVSQTEGVAGRAGQALNRGFGKAIKEVEKASGGASREINVLQRAFQSIQNATVRGGRAIGDFVRSLGLARTSGTGMIRILAALRVGMIAFQAATLGIVGLITVLVALPLVAFFTRTAGGVDRLKSAMEGIRQVINEVVGRFAEMGRAIVSGNFREALRIFRNMGDGLKEIAENAADARFNILQLERANKNLELSEAAVSARIQDLRNVAEDANNTIRDRANAYREIAREQKILSDQEISNTRQLIREQARLITDTTPVDAPERLRLNELIQTFLKQQADSTEEQRQNIKKINDLNKTRKKDEEDIVKAQFGTLQFFKDTLADIENRIATTRPDSPLFDTLLEDAQTLRQEISNIELEVTLAGLTPGSRDALDAELNFLQERIGRINDVDTPDLFRQTTARIKELEQELKNVEERAKQAFEPLAELEPISDEDIVNFSASVLSGIKDLSTLGRDELEKLRERVLSLGLEDAVEQTLLNRIKEAFEELDRILPLSQDVIDQIKARGDEAAIDGGLFGKLFGATPEEAQRIRDELNNLLANVTEGIDAITEQQIASLDRRIAAQKQRVDDTVKIADRGNAELLEAEEDKLAKLQEMRERAVRRQQQLAAIQIALNQAIAISEAIKAIASAASFGPAAPFIIAANIAAIVAGLAAATIAIRNAFGDLPTFYEGTELIAESIAKRRQAKVVDMTRGKDKVTGPGGRDKVIARVSTGERILTDEQNKPLLRWGVKNKDIPGLVGIALGKISVVGQPPRWKDDGGGQIHSDAYLLRLEVKKLIKEQANTRRALEDLKIETGVNKDVIYSIIAGRNAQESYRKQLLR